ncbi:MAG: O-antigen ligase family protein [Elusimicrobia bacterium]|jgi:O-antigen ligase|nr:O-antigen ligase family protein [Elusimicrobiota bacterium]MBK7544591.1 O-antigen ligase family protein [Elusimicrobiota bacterium]MBK7574123.1 O-antigen ligase family protein [Elusimicrobiota bacterium]MBK8422442.1 O-antigen ligase family protein [Elusimicrobiota bacterium]MBK8650979.1 O-antigen ligase family protein [Elusimicrobiota bacterium]
MTTPGGARLETARDGLLIALGLALPLSLAAANVFWGLAAAFALPLLFRLPRVWRPTGLELPWLAGLVWTAASAGLTSTTAGLGHALRSEVLILVFVLAAVLGGRAGLSARWRFWGIAAAVAGVLGAFQWLNVWDRGVPSTVEGLPSFLVRAFSNKGGRAVGLYSNAITFAEVMALAGLAALGGLPREKKAARWLTALAAGAGLFFSQTRGVWLAVFLTLVLWAALRRDKKIARVLGIGVVLAGLAVVASPALRHRAASIGDRHRDSSNRIRLGLWVRSLELMRGRPLCGVGPGQARIPAAELRWGGSVPGEVWTEMHNIYLQVGVEKGLIGLGLFLWFLAALGRVLWRAQERDPTLAGVFWGFVALLLAGLTESWFNDSEVVMNLFFAAGTAWRAAETKI